MIEIGDIGSAPIQNVLEVKDINNIVKCRYVMGDNDSLTKELMSRNDISISFNYPTFVKFKKGDYITFDGERYTLIKEFKAIENKGFYSYELVFHAKEILIQDAQYFYTNSNIHQSEFTLTGNAQYFFQLAVEDINAHFGANFVNLGNIESTDIKQITFASNTNVLNALHQVCEVFGLEYLFVGDTINASKKVNFGDAIDFKVGESVLSVNRREGDNVFTANRILALGSTTNLTREYQGGDYMIGSKRLRIPQDKGTFIDLKEGLQPTEIETAVVIFDDVFPHRIGNVDEVREVEYEDKDEDGNDIILKQWRFKDNGIIFSEDYLLPNEPLMLVFESGRLAGQHFEVAFRKDKYNDTDNSQNYEILLNDRGLPNETLYPQIGDKYVLYNFNIALVSDIYIPEAENKLYDTAVQWLKEQHTDKGVYECPIMTDYARTNDANLEIGQRVNLFAPMFDDTTRQTGKRESRIMGYSKPLLDWSTATYTIGDNAAYSPKSNIQQRITKLEEFEYVDAGVGGASGSVYIIKQFDLTRPTDFNVYSARATDAMYLNRQKGGSVLGDTLFTKNVQTQGVNVSDVFQNSTFTAGAFGTGMQFKNDANGYSYGELDYLRVRKEMLVSQLTIDEIKSVGGTILLSLANLTASNVVDNGTSYRVYFDNQDGKLLNKFVVGDQAIRQTFNGTNIVRYWRLVTGIGVDYIDLSKTDAEQGSSVPLVGDEIIQLGNRTNVNRQHAILLSAYGSDAPSIKQYSGINSFSLVNKEVTVISPSGNKFKGTFEMTSNGTTTAVYKDRGKFVNGTTYYKNDRVSHNGSLWVCDVTNTTVTPNESTTAWIKETSGDSDINNAINSIQVGSQNILNGTQDFLNSPISNWVSRSVSIIPNIGMYNTSSTKTTSAWGRIVQSFNLEDGETYTFSAFVMSDKVDEVEYHIYLKGGYETSYKTISKANEWIKAEYTFTVKSGDGVGFETRVEPRRVSNGASFFTCCYMLEKGNKSSMWSMSQEDIVYKFDVANKNANDANSYIDNVLKGQIEAIQDQLDGKVNSYFYDYDPTLNNIPASEWTTEQLKSEHINDTFTNTTSGKSWRWAKENNVYKWIEITDTASLEALQKAQEALNVANDKMQVFVTEPYTPYKVGDLWVQGASGDIMKCKTTRLTGNFNINDWDRASKYTDDSKANQVGDDLEQFTTKTNAEFNFLNDKIESKVDSQTFNQLDQLVQTHSSQITQLDGSITSTVEKVDNIQIGGVNLAYDSSFSFLNTSRYMSRNNYADLSVDSTNKITLNNSLKIKSLKEGANGTDLQIGTMKPNDGISVNIMISFYAKTDMSSTKMYWRWGFGQFAAPITINGNWQKFEFSLKSPSANSSTLHPYFEGIGSVWISDFMIEYGTKAISWSPAPQDYFNDINSKAQTFYQDNEPTTKNIGDIWIRKSLVDTNGVVNTDQSKNIYQLQMRWNGSTWQRINWSASKSKIEQTDDRISLEVSRIDGEIEEKTNITLDSNKISLAGKTIELKGSTIADSIEAEDLVVGSEESLSQLKVLQDGTFYSKGRNEDGDGIEIDSNRQSIKVTSTEYRSGSGGITRVPSTVEISRNIGGMEIKDANYNSVYITPAGIQANNASTDARYMTDDKAAIIGVGRSDMPYSDLYPDRFAAGVYGTYSNQTNINSFGGVFDLLKVYGLFLNVNSIGSNTSTYSLSKTDVVLSCYNNVDLTISLPGIAMKGQTYLIRRLNSSNVTIKAYYANIHNGTTTVSSIGIPTRGYMIALIWDGQYWLYNILTK